MFKQANLKIESALETWLQQSHHTGKLVRTYHFNSLSRVSDRTAMFTCPFNIAHLVNKGNYMKHVTRCKKNVLFSDWIECPFNYGHQFRTREEVREHVESGECPDGEDHVDNMREIQRHAEDNKEANQERHDKIRRGDEFERGQMESSGKNDEQHW